MHHCEKPNMWGLFIFISPFYGLYLMDMIPNNVAVNGSYYMWCHGCREPIGLSNIYPSGVTWLCPVTGRISPSGHPRQITCDDACIDVYNKSA